MNSGSSEIAENIAGVATATERTTEAVGESQQAAAELSRMSSQLHAAISRFQIHQN